MAAPESAPTLCFIDTNVWLYAFIRAQEDNKHGIAKKVIQANEAIVSTQVINEICVNLLKKTELSEQDIRALIRSFYGSYRVIELNPDILLKASELRDQYSFSFWDSMIVASALYAQCEILYSEDMQSGLQVEEKLIVQNPFKTS